MTYRGKVDEMIQDENEKRLHHLASVTTHIKELSLEINQDVKDSNDFLNEFNSTIGLTQSMLRNTMNKFADMTQTATGKKMMLFIFACIIVFLIVYFVIQRYRTD